MPDTPTRPRRILPLIVLSQFAATSLWFAGNALLPDLERQLGLGEDAVAAITAAVQLGFIAGTLLFAVLNLADRFAARAVFCASALAGAAFNLGLLALPHVENGYALLLGLRFACGFFLAGIYPVGMKLAASWYRQGLGSALGFLVGAQVLGTALPHLVRSLGGGLPWPMVTVVVSALAALGGLLVLALVPEGPLLIKAPRFTPAAIVQAFRLPVFRASACGYFGHMWELYTLWALVPALLSGYGALHGQTLDIPLWSFAVIASGALGCVAGGQLSRSVGSARVAFGNLALSGLCCLASPLAFALPPEGFLAFLIVWGIAVAGDSPQFSALNAAAAPQAYVGSALTIANCIGFTLTIPSLYLATWLASRLPIEMWFVPVAIGPALWLIALMPLARR